MRRYGAAFEALRDEPADGAGLPGHDGHRRRAHRPRHLRRQPASPPAASPSTSPGATDGVDDLLAAYDGQPVVCLAGADAAYAEWGAEAARRAARGRAPRGWSSPASPRDYADDSCAMGVDALDFLTRTREKLA